MTIASVVLLLTATGGSNSREVEAAERDASDLANLARLRGSWLVTALESTLFSLDPQFKPLSNYCLDFSRSLPGLKVRGVRSPEFAIVEPPGYPEYWAYSRGGALFSLVAEGLWEKSDSDNPLPSAWRSLEDLRRLWNAERRELRLPQKFEVLDARGAVVVVEESRDCSVRYAGLHEYTCDESPLVDIRLSPGQTLYCGESLAYYVVISWRVVPFSYRELMAKRLGRSLPDLEFDRVFEDLSKSTQGMEDMPIAGIANILRSLSHQREATVNVVGLTIPTAKLTGVGATVLLALQLYFLAFLSVQNSSRVRVDGDPWIGELQGWLPSFLSYGSSTLLPLASHCSLVWALVSTQGGRVWYAVIVLVLGWSASIATVVRLRRLRSDADARE